MATLLISYDLNAPGRDYPRISARIQALTGTWCHPQKSLWLVAGAPGAEATRNDLKNYVDDSSKLLVVDVTGDTAAWLGLSGEDSQWLKAHL